MTSWSGMLLAIASFAPGAGPAPDAGSEPRWTAVLTTHVEITEIEAGAPALATVGFFDEKLGVAVGHHGAIRYTRDGGRTWLKAKAPAVKMDLDGLEILDARMIWIAGGNQLRRSADGGRQWEALPSFGSAYSGGHYFSFVDENVGWYALGSQFGTAHPLAATRDGGRSWSPVHLPPEAENRIMAIHLLSENTGFVLVAGGTILRTDDGGQSWTGIPVPVGDRRLIPEPNGVPVEAVRFTDPLHGLVVLYSEHPREFVSLQTSDGGKSWREIEWPSAPRVRLGNVFLSRDGRFLTIKDVEAERVVLYRLP